MYLVTGNAIKVTIIFIIGLVRIMDVPNVRVRNNNVDLFESEDFKIIKCNRNCNKCKNLNVRTDDKGNSYAYDCLKYEDSVFRSEFESTKEFKTEENNK